MQNDDILAVIDAGNSRVKLGLFNLSNKHDLPVCLGITAIDLDQALDPLNLGNWVNEFLDLHQLPVSKAILSGSNIKMIERLEEIWPQARCKLEVKIDRAEYPLRIEVDFPEKVGMDRLLNALAIHKIKPFDHLGVIVDSGTATTVDVINQAGAFLGGAIFPGLKLSALALHHYTSLLPHVDVNMLSEVPLRPIGKNTQEAILNGILWGHLGAIHELVNRYAECCDGPVACYMTGGAASILLPHLKREFKHFPYLPLQGLALWQGK